MNVVVLGNESILSASPQIINSPHEGGTYTVAIVSSSSWSASVNNGYCNISPNTGGAGSSSVQVFVYFNPDSSAKQSTITITNSQGMSTQVQVFIEANQSGRAIG